ncbi:hypothetical protein [Roseibium sp.]|uniref:hypothetical protein n=1 Tax=Roseibium sp. TaxID=1936156 RepID=UPI003A970657
MNTLCPSTSIKSSDHPANIQSAFDIGAAVSYLGSGLKVPAARRRLSMVKSFSSGTALGGQQISLCFQQADGNASPIEERLHPSERLVR